MRLPFLVLVLCSLSFSLMGQGRGHYWYFGTKAGVKFDTGGPTGLTDGEMSTGEGCASISDRMGNLLFYTDGSQVWNRFHTVMPNGSGLKGHSSSCMSAIIVPQPGNDSIYYVWTVDGGTGGRLGVHWSEINMKLDGGKGDVTSLKNVTIFSSGANEFVTSCKHKNNRDFWVIVHENSGTNFRAYLIDDAGVSGSPVYSSVLPSTTTGTILCNGKASPDGKFLAVGFAPGGDYLYDFDNATGRVSNPTKLSPSYSYGIEFSPNSRLLYTRAIFGDSLLQFDLYAGSRTDVKRSRLSVDPTSSSSLTGAMQLAEDGNLYMIAGLSSHLSLIDEPNSRGTACRVVQDSIYLEARSSSFGLPAFIQSFFNILNFDYINTCLGDNTCLFVTGDSLAFDSLTWNFGDPATGSLNRAKGFTAKHIFSDTGLFTVCAITYDTFGFVDTVCRDVRIIDDPQVRLAPDTLLCAGSVLEISPTFSTEKTWLWIDSSTDSSFNIDSAGLYWVRVENACGVDTAFIQVAFDDVLSPDLGPQIDLCDGETRELDGSTTGATNYLWNTGASSAKIIVSTAGWYRVETTNACGTFADSVEVTYTSPPTANLPDQDTIVCLGDEIILRSGSAGSNFTWPDGSTGETYTVSEPGNYWLRVDNFCGSDVDSIFVDFENCCAIGIPNAFSPNDDGINDGFALIRDYCQIDNFQLTIYNRLGQIVFETTDPDEKWDGTKNGKDLDLGVYVYKLRYTLQTPSGSGILPHGQEQLQSGNITLIR